MTAFIKGVTALVKDVTATLNDVTAFEKVMTTLNIVFDRHGSSCKSCDSSA